MTDLIKRLEEAEAGSRELDALVFRRFGGPLPKEFAGYGVELTWQADGSATMPVGEMQVRYDPPAYTASLDAALALADRVLPGWYCAVQPWFHANPDRTMYRAYVIQPDWSRWTPVDDDWCEVVLGPSAPTPALALCIAVLKATDTGREG
jgi:hypothetical protein